MKSWKLKVSSLHKYVGDGYFIKQGGFGHFLGKK